MLRGYLPFPNRFPFLPPVSLLQAEVHVRLHQKLKAALNLTLGQAGQCSLCATPPYQNTQMLCLSITQLIFFFSRDLQKVH